MRRRRALLRPSAWRTVASAALIASAISSAFAAESAADTSFADVESEMDMTAAVASLASDVIGSVARDPLDEQRGSSDSASGSGDGDVIAFPDLRFPVPESERGAVIIRNAIAEVAGLPAIPLVPGPLPVDEGRSYSTDCSGSSDGSGRDSVNVGDAESMSGSADGTHYVGDTESSSGSADGAHNVGDADSSSGSGQGAVDVGDAASSAGSARDVGDSGSSGAHEDRSIFVETTSAPSTTAPTGTSAPATGGLAQTPGPATKNSVATPSTTVPSTTTTTTTDSDDDLLVLRGSAVDDDVMDEADSCDDEASGSGDCSVRTFSLSISSDDGSGSAEAASQAATTSDSEAASTSSSTGSSGSSASKKSQRSTPYSSSYCRCKTTECQNEYPGIYGASICVSVESDGSCPSGYKSCLATDSYKLSASTTSPNSVTNVDFILLAADIIGSFYNLGDEDPISRDANWWVSITLPSGWRFVAWDSTAVDVTLSEYDDSVSSKVKSCSDVIGTSACDTSSANRVGFIDIMSLLESRQDLMSSSSGAPLAFSLSKSVVTGYSSGSSEVTVALAYVTLSGSIDTTTTSRRMRELSVTADASASSSASSYELGNMSAMTLATMDLPQIEAGRLDSSLLWVDEDTSVMSLSFSTSTIIGPGSVNPKVCVDLRSSSCASKAKVSDANVTFLGDATAVYVKDGNPFINLYGQPGDTTLTISTNTSTYFCIENLLPSGFETNDSWEINTEFAFQIQISDIVWTGDESAYSSESKDFQLPSLGAIILMDEGNEMASDCAQILVHEQTYSKYALSVYSVMSVTIFAVGLVGAVLITRMNGVSFSIATFYNDMASVSIVLIFVLSIIGNAIWVSISAGNANSSSSQIYYLLHQIATCFLWTMMTAFCFHWSTVLFHDIRQSRRVVLMVLFFLLNVVFYAFQLFGVVSLTEFYKCAYDDYLKNPLYTKHLCDSDYCPDLQPYQWKYAADDVCKDVAYSDWFFPLLFSGEILLCLAGMALLVLGAFVLRRGARLMEQSGELLEERVITIMRKSLLTYLGVIIAIAVVLATACVMNVVLYFTNSTINAVVWYCFTIWLPYVIPPAGFLVLQWNPRLHGASGNPSFVTKDIPVAKDDKVGTADALYGLLSDGWAGITRFPDTTYNPIVAESIDGSQNVLALSLQLVSPIPLAHACFVELYVTDMGAGGNDVTGEDEYFEELPVMGYHRASISSFIQSGIQRESMLHRRQSVSREATATTLLSQWARVGFTETVLPTLLPAKAEGDPVMQIATFLSVLQIPVMPANPALRFVVYEIPDPPAPVTTSDRISNDPTIRMRTSSLQLDERAKSARVSGMGLAPPTKPRVFCEFTCSSGEVLASDEVSLLAGQRTQRVFSDATIESPDGSAEASIPQLKVRSMTVSTRTLKENQGFYISKCFQFAQGNEMVVEDMTESVLTNEIPRQYLELLVTERAQDLLRAKNDLTNFEAKVKSGFMSSAYDNLIDQLQGENDQTVVHNWLEERVQRRKMYVDALGECHQVCVDRAEEGINFKASTEKKSLVLRFLPVNLHVQDLWVGPSSELRSQRSRRTSIAVKAYPTVTVGAFSAHCFKFRSGTSILSLRAKLQQRSLSRLQSEVSEAGDDDSEEPAVDWMLPEARSLDETRWQLTTRLDMCVSQALASVAASFCRNLELALQHPSERHFLHLIDSIGFLFQVESLLSTQGKELGMLEDFSAAVDALKNVTFVLDTSPPSHLPPTLLNLHMKNTTLPSVVSVRLSKGASRGAFTIVVGVRASADVLAAIPENLRSGGVVPVTPVLFTQGINEMQTLANNASGRKTTLQDTINLKSFQLLRQYVDKYRQLAAQQPEVVPTPAATIDTLLASLEERIEAASKQKMKTKHPKIIQESSRLCRLLGAGRVTSCKSAKDRTSMSVTLEQIQLLSDHHGLPPEFVIRTVSTMRSNGVRLENAFKNTGKRQYAFNALQRSLLPEEYRCPEGTYGRGNVS